MNIVVAVKYVPDATADRTFSADNTVDRDGVDGLLSELDEYAVEQALQIVEAGDGEVTVLTVGPERRRRRGPQGAADGRRRRRPRRGRRDPRLRRLRDVADPGQGDREARLRPACSSAWRSTDAGLGVVPTLVAERLGLPAVTFASEITVDGDTVKIRRDGDVATQEIEATGKLVVSVTDQTGEARYPSFKGIMAAKKKPVEEWIAGRPGHRRRPRSASTTPGPRSSRSSPARRAPPARSSPTRETAAPSSSSSSRPRSSSERA